MTTKEEYNAQLKKKFASLKIINDEIETLKPDSADWNAAKAMQTMQLNTINELTKKRDRAK
jgi:hypothetical protein